MLPDLTVLLPTPWLQFWAATERFVVLFGFGWFLGTALGQWRSR